MNHVYRLKRSGRTQQLQPVPETARAASKGTRTSKTLAQTVSGTLASFALGGIASLTYAQQAPPASAPTATQLPQGGVVTRGSANIVTNTGQAQLTVNQSSNRAVIDWASFNVGSQAKVQFNQPSTSAVTLNNILGNNASQIYGQISANGQVFLSNPNGVYFSPTSQVNVGGLVATTGKANADEFMAGKASFNRAGSTGSVVNQGQLTSAAGGYIALLAPEVRNQGVVVAQAGTVALASGEAITLNFNHTGTGLAGITTTPQAIAALVENRSAVLAEGGQIILSAHALASLQGSVVKNSGQLSATSLSTQGGKIVLMGDSIELTGTSQIEASGATGGGTVLVGGDWQGSGDTRKATKVTMAPGASIEANASQQGDGGKVVLWSDVHNPLGVTQLEGHIEAKAAGSGSGGQVETSGATLKIGPATQVNTLAPQGTNGQWLLDPANITISAGADSGATNTSGTFSPNSSVSTSVIHTATIQSALSAGNVTISTTNIGTAGTELGNIVVNDSLSWSLNTLTLNAHNNVTINKTMTLTGVAGLSVQYGQQSASATGNNALFTVNAPVNIASTGSFATKLGSGVGSVSTSYTIVNSLGAAADVTTAPASPTLQGMARAAVAGNSFVLGSDIDATGTSSWNSNSGFTPIGNNTTAFSGTFNGLGHTITGLTAAAAASNYQGLFGKSTGSIANVTLTGASVSGSTYVGALAGYGADFYNVRILGGSVTGAAYVGGMAGFASSSVSTANTSAAVNGVDAANTPARFIGGLLGAGSGAVNNAVSSGAVTATNANAALATGSNPLTSLSLGTLHSVGGLIGQLAPSGDMSLTNNVSTGPVTVTTAASTCAVNYCISNVGGLIGTLGSSPNSTAANWRVTLTDSSTSGHVSVSSTTAASMSSHLTNIANNTGGMIGRIGNIGSGLIFNGDLTLTHLSTTGNVSGYSGVGGLVGYSHVAGGTASANVFSNLSATGNITGFGSTAQMSLPTLSSSFQSTGLGGLFAASEGAKAGQIQNSSYSGDIVSNGGGYIGGLVGAARGQITNSFATGTISVPSTSFSGSIGVVSIGGLVGYLGGNSVASGVSGGSYSNVSITLGASTPWYFGAVGGLVGHLAPGLSGADVSINNSHALGDIQITSAGSSGISTYIGGLVGFAEASTALKGTGAVQDNTLTVSGDLLLNTTISNYLGVGSLVVGPGILPGSYIVALGTGTGGSGTYTLNQAQTVGSATVSGIGLNAYPSAYINNSYASGNVMALKATNIGGLAGSAGSVFNSHASGNVTGYQTVGGLTGSSNAIYGSYALGNATLSGLSGGTIYIGGLTGTNRFGIADSYWAGQSVSGSINSGGLVGYAYGPILNSYVTGSGQVSGASSVGGLVGVTISDITGSYSTANVTLGTEVGGLVGRFGAVDTLSTLSSSWSSGSVTGTSSVGGLVGISHGTVVNSYATGAVTSTGSAEKTGVGGLLGTNLAGGSVSSSFATGPVVSALTTLSTSTTGSNARTVYAGGLIGFNESSGSINNSYASGSVTINNNGSAGGLIGYTAIPTVNTLIQGAVATVNSTTWNVNSLNLVRGVLGVGATVTGVGGASGVTIVSATAYGTNGAYTLSQTTSSTGTWTISNPTGSSAASISGNTLTLGGAVTGYFAPGTVITGTNIPANTYITGVLSTAGTLANGFGGAGSQYTLSNSSTFSGAVTGTNIALSVGATVPAPGFLVFKGPWSVSGGFAVGMAVTGPGINPGTTITGYTSKTVNGTTTKGYTLSDSSFPTFTTPVAVTGQLASPNISNVYATGIVRSNTANTQVYYSYLGGLIGQVASSVPSSVAAAYSSGAVTAPVTTPVTAKATNTYTGVAVRLSNITGGGIQVGATVTGAGIPAGTKVLSFSSATSTYTLSQTVTVTANQSISVTPGVLVGGVIGYVGTGNTTATSSAGAAVAPTFSAMYFNTSANTGYFAVGNDAIGAASVLGNGATGLSNSDLRTTSAMPGLNFTTNTLGSAASGRASAGNYWVLVDAAGTYNNASGATGATYPMLASEYALKVSSGHQLQLMGLDPAASYALQNSISFANSDVWSSTGFVPVGTTANPFTGGFIGSALSSGSQAACPAASGGCTISNLTINSTQPAPVGLFGTVGAGATLSGIRLLDAQVSGVQSVGTVVGANAGILTFSSSTGTVTSSNSSGTGYGVGGIVGVNTGAVDRVFSTATVSGTAGSAMLAGGLIGDNQSTGTLINAYASSLGSISSGGYAGGLAGANSGAISNSYAAGPVAGLATVSGGLVGNNASGTLGNSFWDSTVTGQSAPVASNPAAGTRTHNAGLSTVEMKTLANYNSATASNAGVNPAWNLTTIWNPPVAGDLLGVGGLYPALRDFLIPITVTANPVTKVYDALAYAGPVSVRYSLPNVSLSGTVAYDSSITGFTNAGGYTVMPNGLYSNQYNVSFASGPLTITKRPLTFTASLTPKVYDGTNAMDPTNITINNLVGAQTLSITSVSAVSSQVSANSSNYINSITLGNATDASGGLLANYSAPSTLSRSNAPVTITPIALSNVSALNKVYDGTTTATFAGGSLTGVLAADSALVTLSGNFASKNVADSITVTPVFSGSSGSNYTVAPGTLTANITRLNSVTWVGGSTGNWFDPNNWAPSTNLSATGAVPDLSNVANVVIPSGKTVSFNSTVTAPAQAGTVNIDSLAGSGGTAGSVALFAGTLNVGTGGVSLATLTQTGGTLSFTGNSSLTTTGAMTLGTVSATGSLNVTSSGGDITLGGNITMGNSPLVIKATGNIVQNVSTTVSSTGGNINYWADSDASGAGSIALNAGSSNSVSAQISAGAGNIVLGGGNGATAADGQAVGAIGVQLGDYASLSGANINVLGKGGATAAGIGVSIGSSTTVSGTGSVSITGTGGSASGTSNNRGVDVGASTIESTGSGSVTITGTGGGSASGVGNYGVVMTGTSVSRYAAVRTNSGALTIVATSGFGVPSASAGFVPFSYVQLGSSSQTGPLTVQASNMLTSRSSSATSFQTTGAITLEPLVGNTSFTSNLGVPFIAAGASSVTIGRSGNTAGSETGHALSVQGPVNIYGNTTLFADLTATGQVSVSGALSTGVSTVKLTAPSLLVTGTGASNAVMNTDIGTFAGSGLGIVYLINQGPMTIGTVGGTSGISSSRYMDISTLTGDLTVSSNLATTSNWGVGAAIVLNAGQSKSALDPTGGNVVVTGTPSITVGAGGNAIAYTGSVAGSTALATLAGAGSGRFRYGSDETTKNYTSYLGTGLFAIYREQPTVSWSSGSDQVIVYGQSPTISNLTGSLSTFSTTGSYSTGLQNGDEAKVSQALMIRTSTLPKTAAVLNASNVYDAGLYEASKTGSAEALGYAGVNPLITVTKAPLAITVKSASKTYDAGPYSGGAGLTYSGFVGTETATALGGKVVYGGAAQGAANAGTYALTASGLTAKNYALAYTSGTLTINPKALTIRVNDDARFVGQTDAVGYNGVSYTGFVPGQSITNLGNLSISRTSNSSVPGTYTGVLQASIAGLTNSNYAITYVPGNYTIVPADQLLVKFANIATTYGTDPVYSVTSAQYLKSSTNTVIDLTSRASLTGSTFSLTDGDGGATSFSMGPQATSLSSAGKLNAYGGYQLAASSITNSSTNYKNTITTTGALTVNPLAIDVAASHGLVKTYDGNADMKGLGLSLTGVLGVDQVSVIGQGAYISANAGITNYAVNNLVLGGLDKGNYVLSAGNSFSGTNGSITKASLTVTAKSDLKLYDGLEYLGGNGVVYSGFVNNESASVLGGTVVYTGDSQNAVNAGSYTITPQGLSSTNYNITYVDAALTVAPVTITTRPIDGQLQGPIAKVYDGSDTATLSSANYILSGWVSTDSATVSKTTGSYDNTNVGSGKMVTVSLTGADYLAGGATILSNYVLPTSITGAVGVITPKPVTVTGLAAANKTYDGNSSVVITNWGAVSTGVVNESLTLLSGAASFSDADAFIGKTVTASGYSLADGTGGVASNYLLTSSSATTTANIDPRAVNVSSLARTTTYDGTTTYADLTSNTGFVSSALAQGDWVASVTKVAGGAGVAPGGIGQAGSYTVTPSAAVMGAGLAGNYIFSYEARNNTVDKANLALSAVANLTGNVYNGSAYTGTYTMNALGNDASGMSVTGVATGTNAGTYTSSLAVSGAPLLNYNTPVVTDANLVISAKPVTVTNTSRSTTYDGTSSYSTLANTTSFTAALVGSDTVASVTQTANGVTSTGVAHAGSFTVTPSSAVMGTGLASNYDFSYANSTHTVDKANLALSAVASLTGNVYNGTVYTGTYTMTALGNDASGMSVTGVATGTNAGSYTSSLGVTGTALANYNTPVVTDANLVISAKPVTVTNTSRSTTYDGTSSYSTLANATAFTAALVGSDKVASVTQTANGVTPAGVAQAGSFTVTPSSAVMGTGLASNYDFSYAQSTHTVDKANLALSAVSSLTGNVYNGNAYTGTYTMNALGNDASGMSVTGLATGINAGTYTSSLAVTGAALLNYNTPVVTDANLVISAKPVTVTNTSRSTTYDGTSSYSTLANTTSFTAALVGSDTVASVTQTANGVTSTGVAQAGSFTVTPSSAVMGTGLASNYDFSYANSTHTVDRANLALSAVASLTGNVYNGSAYTGTYTMNALGNDASGMSVTGVATGTNAGTYTSSLGVTGTALANYNTPVVTDANLVISAKPVTVTNTSRSTTYDGTSSYSTLANDTAFTAALVGSDKVASVTQTANGVTPAGVAQAGNFTVTPSSAVMGTGLASNYDFSYAHSTHTVDKANLALTAVASLTGNVYNGSAYTGTYTMNALGNDASGMNVTGVATGTNAGTYTSSLAVTGAALTNYNTPVVTNADLVIAKAALTATGNSSQLRYSGTTHSVNGFTVTGLQGKDNASGLVGISASGASGMNVGSYPNTMTVVDQPNYTVTGVNGLLYIGAAPITLINGTLQNAVNKVYDGTNVATLSESNYVLTGWLGSDRAIVSKTLGTYDTADAGTNKTVTVDLTRGDYLASGSTDLLNYILPTKISGSVGQISKATVTPRISASNKVYDTTVTANGAVNLAGVFSVDAAAASAVATSYSFADANVGQSKTVTASGITLGSGLTSNYVLASTAATGTANITPAPLTVTAINDAKFVTRNDVAGYAGFAVIGLLNGQSPDDAGISAGVTVSRSNLGIETAGEYRSVLVPAGNATIGNYAVSYVPGTFTIVPAKQLLVQATSSNTAYGTVGSPVVTSVSYLDDRSNTIKELTLNSQAVGDNTVYTYADGASGTVSFSAVPTGTRLSAGGYVNVGSYGLAASNFSKTTSNLNTNTVTVSGSLTVQPLAVTVAATPGVTTYNSATQTQAVTSGLLSGDATGIAGVVSQRNAGIYTSALSVSGNDAANYRVTYTNSNYTINPALLIPSIVAADKVYDGNTTASLSSTDNRLGSDVLNVSATGRFADKNVGTAKLVTVSSVQLSGADAANYSVSPTASTTATITRLAQVNWVGGTTGSWFDPANWAGGAVPDVANVANVTIPAGVTVIFDKATLVPAQAGPVSIDSLGVAGSLSQSDGTLNVGAGGVTLNTLTQTGGTLATTGALTLGNLSQSAGSMSAGSLSTLLPYSHTGSGSLTVAGQVVPVNDSVTRNLPLLPVVLTPDVSQEQGSYQVTVLKLPQGNDAGAVHIALRDGLADGEIPLPAALQNWLNAAGAGLSLEGAMDGVELSPDRNSIRIFDLANRRYPLQLALKSGEQRVSFWIVKRP